MVKNKLKIFIKPLIIAFILGIVADIITMSDKSDPKMSTFTIGFFIIVPTFLFLFLLLIGVFDIKNKIIITLASAALFFLIMVFAFWFYKFRTEYVGDMYGFLYFLGFIPSTLIGILFGLYISKVVNK